MTCAVWSTATFAGGVGVVTGFTVVSGDALGPAEAPPAGVDPSPIVWTFCFLLQAAKASAKSTGAATSLSRINVRNAFKSGQAKNKRFLHRGSPLSRFAPKICQRDLNRLSIAMPSSIWGKGAALCALFLAGCQDDSHRRGVIGFETYYHSPSAAELAQNIQSRLCSLKGSVNRGVHTADFRVVRKALYPAVLVECGYLSNRSEGREARNGDYRELLADKIAQAIVEQRHGVGAYRAPATAVVKQEPPRQQPPPPPQQRKPVLTPPGE